MKHASVFSNLDGSFQFTAQCQALDCPDVVGKASLDGRAPYVSIFLRLDGELITKASFQAFGCGVTIAVCSMLTDLITGQTVSCCGNLTDDTLVEALDVPPDKQFCAGLVIGALQDALQQIREGEAEDD